MADNINPRDYILLWQKNLYKRFSTLCRDGGYNSSLTNKLMNTIGALTCNVLNGADMKEEIAKSVAFITKRIAISPEQLTVMFNSARYLCVKERILEVIPSEKTTRFVVRYKQLNTRGNIESDSIDIVLPRDKADNILKFPDEEIIALLERYNFLCPNSGYFWSIHPRLYECFGDIGFAEGPEIIEVIEGFASPYNHNLPKYCSPYPADTIFGSLGNFFDVIKTRGDPKEDRGKVRRWIINPPYTEHMLNRTRTAIENRLNSFPQDEFYFLLPDWETPLYKTIKTRGLGVVLEPKEYEIFDHIQGIPLSPPVKLFLGYLKSTPVDENPLFNQLIEIIKPIPLPG